MGSHAESRVATGDDVVPGSDPVPPHHVHRVRDLSPRDRLIALALALALLISPFASAARLFNWWTPNGDDALIELRARDVGTPRTPLVGQPSSSGQYGQRQRNAAHPGPIEFYLLAPAERLLGGGVGMLSTIAALTAFCVLIAAWAVFRQLGRGGGLAAAVALAALLWTAGAAVQVDPLSSSVGRFPMLCSVVLLWCLLCGDIRLLALTCAVVSFTLQQHLSVVPATLVVTAVGVVGLGVVLVRRGVFRDAIRRREALGSVALAVVLGLVLWSPVLYEQATRNPGNIERIIRYAGDDSRANVGPGAAVRQVAHAIGLPPLLGHTNVSGSDLLARVSVLTGVSAVLAVALGVAGVLAWRRRSPRLAALVVMAGAVALGGLFNGSNVPNSLEEIRISFYHWTFTLAFLELLIVLMAVGPIVWQWWSARAPSTARPRAAAGRSALVSMLAGPLVVLLVATPAVANLFVHRADNRMFLFLPKGTVDQMEREVRSHLASVPQPTLLLSTAGVSFSGVYEAIAARLIASGADVVFPRNYEGSVADGRLVDYRTVRSAIVVATGVGGPPPGVPGTVIATADPVPHFDRGAFDLLVRQAGAGPSKVVLGSKLERELERRVVDDEELQPGLGRFAQQVSEAERRTVRASLAKITEQPAQVLSRRSVLNLLARTPMVSPALDHRALERAARTYPTVQGSALQATHLSAYLLDLPQLLQYAPPP